MVFDWYYKENYERIPDYHGLSTLRDAYESRFAYSNYSSALFGASPTYEPKRRTYIVDIHLNDY